MKRNPPEVFFLALLTVLGLAVRIVAPAASDFPLNDGGLFYQMIVELKANHFSLPVFTNYNFSNIPFAYPPLAFYLYGLLAEISGTSLFTLMRLLPAIVSAGAIPVFYLLAKEILGNQPTSLFAALTFALAPRTFDWLIMGGGVTRSLGFLFAIAAIHQTFLLFSNPTNRALVLTTVFSALVLLTHPEAAVHTAIAAIFFYLWKSRSRTGAIHAVVVAVGALVLSAPWWVTVLARHGIHPFQAALNAAGENSISFALRIFALLKFDFTDEPFVQWIAVIGLVGIFILLAQRKPALPIWLMLIAFIEPRGGTLYMMIPLSLAAGVTFSQAVRPALTTGEKTPAWVWNAFIGFFIFYGMINAFSAASTITGKLTLSISDRHAFSWIQDNTPTDANFAIVSGRLPLNDAVSEWFPVLAGRKSAGTVFGYEWVNDGNFNIRAEDYETLQACSGIGIPCLEAWIKPRGVSFVLIHESQKSILTEQLENFPAYEEVYREGNIILFQKIK